MQAGHVAAVCIFRGCCAGGPDRLRSTDVSGVEGKGSGVCQAMHAVQDKSVALLADRGAR